MTTDDRIIEILANSMISAGYWLDDIDYDPVTSGKKYESIEYKLLDILKQGKRLDFILKYDAAGGDKRVFNVSYDHFCEAANKIREDCLDERALQFVLFGDVVFN